MSAQRSAASCVRSAVKRGQAAPGRPASALEGSATSCRRTMLCRSLPKVFCGSTRTPGAAELLDEQPEVEQRRALPPVGGGQPVAEPAEARDRLPEGRVVPLGGAVPRQAPLARDLGGQEAARRLPDRLLLFRRRELHPYFRGSPSPRC